MDQKAMAVAINNNLAARRALLESSPPFVKDLGVFSGALGGSTRIKLYNVGVVTSILLQVQAQVDIGVAIATLSPMAPFNLINRVRLTDFDGVDRVNCSGFELFVLNCVRDREYWGYQNEAGSAAVLSNPTIPTAVGNNATLNFFLRIPLAYNPQNDLRGALLAQVTNGEVYVTIDWNSIIYGNGNADALYNGAATTTVAVDFINVQAWQEYLAPQAIGGVVPLPQFDLMTVYEINGAIRTTDNLAVGTEKLINIPNVRTVIGASLVYVNNGVMSAGTDLQRLRVLANGNSVVYEASPSAHLLRMREWLGGDLRAGAYLFPAFRQKPIETNLYGNAQIGVTPAAVTAGNTYMGFCTESFYTKGTTLPGQVQTA